MGEPTVATTPSSPARRPVNGRSVKSASPRAGRSNARKWHELRVRGGPGGPWNGACAGPSGPGGHPGAIGGRGRAGVTSTATGTTGLTYVTRSALAPKQLLPLLTFGFLGGDLGGQDSRRAPLRAGDRSIEGADGTSHLGPASGAPRDPEPSSPEPATPPSPARSNRRAPPGRS